MSNHPVFENYSEKSSDILGLFKKGDSKKRQKILKKGLGKKQKLTTTSQPELLFLQFDPNKNNSQIINSENSTNADYEVCTQPDQKCELRTGKRSWHPPTKQSFNNKEIKDNNFTSMNTNPQLRTVENISKDKNEYIEISKLSVKANENIQLRERSESIDKDNLEKTKGSDIFEQSLDDVEEDKCLTDVKSDKQIDFEENNNLFSSMDDQEIDELIDKNIENHLSAEYEIESEKTECQIQDHVVSVHSDIIITTDSDDGFNISTNEIDEIYRLDQNENENKLLEDDMIVKNSSPPNDKLLIKGMKEFLKTEEAANEIFDDKEENEFDLSDSQFFQIERDYSKSKGHVMYSDCSTQTMQIHEVHNSVENVPQMMGRVRKLKNNIQKIRQCIEELKKIDTVLLKARKEICHQRNMSHSWNSPTVNKHLPPLL